jgi:hypothetical protein
MKEKNIVVFFRILFFFQVINQGKSGELYLDFTINKEKAQQRKILNKFQSPKQVFLFWILDFAFGIWKFKIIEDLVIEI